MSLRKRELLWKIWKKKLSFPDWKEWAKGTEYFYTDPEFIFSGDTKIPYPILVRRHCWSFSVLKDASFIKEVAKGMVFVPKCTMWRMFRSVLWKIEWNRVSVTCSWKLSPIRRGEMFEFWKRFTCTCFQRCQLTWRITFSFGAKFVLVLEFACL